MTQKYINDPHDMLGDSNKYFTHGNTSDTMWMSNTWQQAMHDKQQFINIHDHSSHETEYKSQEPILYAEVGDAAYPVQNNLSSFGDSCHSHDNMSEPAPYATTTLAMGNKMRTLDGKKFNCIPQNDNGDSFTNKTNSSSGGDSLFSEVMTPSPNAQFMPSQSKASNESYKPKSVAGSDSGLMSSYIPNWSEMFPPPPAYPPSDLESAVNTPRIARNYNSKNVSSNDSHRTFSSPNLAKRMAIQHMNTSSGQSVGNCHRNIWNNPMHSVNGDNKSEVSYLQSIQSQNFPHIPNYSSVLKNSENPKKIDIYENPSEHYASINFKRSSPKESREIQNNPHIVNMPAFKNNLVTKYDDAKSGKPHDHRVGNYRNNPVNFYGYGGETSEVTDYETGCSDYEGTVDDEGGTTGDYADSEYRGAIDNFVGAISNEQNMLTSQCEDLSFRHIHSDECDSLTDLGQSDMENDCDNNNKLAFEQKR